MGGNTALCMLGWINNFPSTCSSGQNIFTLHVLKFAHLMFSKVEARSGFHVVETGEEMKFIVRV